jgi:hypothetical protein
MIVQVTTVQIMAVQIMSVQILSAQVTALETKTVFKLCLIATPNYVNS